MGFDSLTILDIIRKYEVHASLKAVDASRGMPPMTLRLRYLTLKLRALIWVLRRPCAGRLVGCGILGCSGPTEREKRRRTQT